MKIKDDRPIRETTGTRKRVEAEKSSFIWKSKLVFKIAKPSRETLLALSIFNTYHATFESPSKKLDTIKKGLLSTSIMDLSELFGGNQAYMAHLLSITQPTLRKYIKERKQLDTNKSEHIIELFELFEKGVDTFGSIEEFKKWIESPNVLFQEPPVNLLTTITGINIVKNALLRLDYGVLA